MATDDDKLDTIEKDVDEVIPVELMYFKGHKVNKGIELYWATASEINNYGFYVERKIGGDKIWQSIGFVKGNNNSNIEHQYVYLDRTTEPNNIYQYRLRQMDIDGTVSSFSNVITISYSMDFEFDMIQNTPNPFSSSTSIRYSIPYTSYVQIRIIKQTGETVASLVNDTQNANNYEIIFDGKNQKGEYLPNGVYICKIQSGNDIKTIKMVIAR